MTHLRSDRSDRAELPGIKCQFKAVVVIVKLSDLSQHNWMYFKNHRAVLLNSARTTCRKCVVL